MAVRFEDYYKTLGVGRDATEKDIVRAYRKLARRYHPDVCKEPDADKQFTRVTEAYEVLRDPDKRKRYDELGADWQAGQEFQPPPGWEDVQFQFRGGAENARGFDASPGGFTDFFEAFFGGGGGGGRGGRRQADPFGGFDRRGGHGTQASPGQVESAITVTLEEAFHGATRNVRLSGDGGASRAIDVKIPRGVTAGSRIRLRGQGGGGRDLILTVRIAPHARFAIEGHDLTTDIRLAAWEAALGARIPVSTLDGEVMLSVPAGTGSGARLRLKGRGLPERGASDRGDLFVRVQIAMPRELDETERELYEQLQARSKFEPRGQP